MNLQKWSKSILSIYNLIPRITDGIDKLVLTKGVNSSQIFCSGGFSTFKQVENIISLTQKKVNLINLKILTDEILLEMKKEHSKILILRFIEDVCTDDILKVLKLTRRTFFRRLNASLKEFEHIVYLRIINDKQVYKLFSCETFLEDIFEKINAFTQSVKDENCIMKYAENICGLILNRVKKNI